MSTGEESFQVPVARGGEAPRRRRRWPWVVLAIVVLVVGVPLVTWYVLVTRAERRLEAVEANLSFRLVPPGEVPTLWGPAPAEDENAAPVYAEALERLGALLEQREDWEYSLDEEPTEAELLADEFTRMKIIWGFEPFEGNEDLFVENPGELDYENLPADLVPPRDVARARKFLAHFAEVFELRDRAAALPGYREDLDWSRGIDILLPNLGPMWDLSELTLLQSAVDAEAGEWDDAYEHILACLAMARHVDQEPLLVQTLVAGSMRGLVVEPLAGMIHLRPPSPVTAAWMRALLMTDAGARMKAACATEASIFGGIFDDILSGKLSVSEAIGSCAEKDPSTGQVLLVGLMKSFFINAKASYLDVMDRYVRAADQPAPDALAEMERIDTDVMDLADSGWAGKLVALFLPSLRTALEVLFRDEAQGSAASVALDLAAYRAEHGEYPAALADLPGAERLPKDPFSGEPFHYRREGQGFVLWSVGPDGDDDGGVTMLEKEEAGTSTSQDDGDIVLRVGVTAPEPAEAEPESENP